MVLEAYNNLQGFLYIWLTFYKSYCDELERTKLTNLKTNMNHLSMYYDVLASPMIIG